MTETQTTVTKTPRTRKPKVQSAESSVKTKKSPISPTGWIENLTPVRCVFMSPKGAFKLARAGFLGSIASIDESISRDPWVLRAVQRGKIRFISEDEALERSEDLVDEDNEQAQHRSDLLQYMDENASERWERYRVDLPEEAEPKRSQYAEEVLAQIASVKPTGHGHSDDSGTLEGMTPGKRMVTRPLPSAEVLTSVERGEE